MSILAFLLALVAFCIRTETGHDTITDILLLLVLLLFMVFGVAGKKLITTFVSPERIALEGQHLKNLDDLEIDRQRQKDFAADNGA